MILIIGSTIIALFMGVTMVFVRMKTAQRPTSIKRIILPPIFMSTGALMFLFPVFRIETIQVIEAFVLGMICSIFLIATTKFEVKQNNIFLIPSKLFIFILFGLLAIRLIVKIIIGSTISFEETSSMFFILAFGMILTWRIAMVYKYIQLKKSIVLTEGQK